MEDKQDKQLDVDFFKIKIKKTRVKTPTKEQVEADFNMFSPKGRKWNEKPFENTTLRAKCPEFQPPSLAEKHNKTFFFRFHKTNYEDKYPSEQVRKISRLLLEKNTDSTWQKQKGSVFNKTYYQKKKELLSNTQFDDFYITKTNVGHILDPELRLNTEIDRIKGRDFKQRLISLKRNKKRSKNLSTYISSLDSNFDGGVSETTEKLFGDGSVRITKPYLITELLNPKSTSKYSNFIEKELMKPRENNLSYSSYSSEGEKGKEERKNKYAGKHIKELETKYDFFKPSKETLEAFYNSNKYSIRGKTTSTLYRSAIDRYLSPEKQKKTFIFDEEFKSHFTRFFGAKEKIQREIDRKKKWFPETYHKHIPEKDINKKYLEQKLPFHNLDCQIKRDWNSFKKKLPNSKLNMAQLKKLDKEKKENLNILKDFKAFKFSKIEHVARKKISDFSKKAKETAMKMNTFIPDNLTLEFTLNNYLNHTVRIDEDGNANLNGNENGSAIVHEQNPQLTHVSTFNTQGKPQIKSKTENK